MVPTTFKSKSALSTSNDVFSTNDLCDLAPLLTKMSTYYDKKLSNNFILFYFLFQQSIFSCCIKKALFQVSTSALQFNKNNKHCSQYIIPANSPGFPGSLQVFHEISRELPTVALFAFLIH